MKKRLFPLGLCLLASGIFTVAVLPTSATAQCRLCEESEPVFEQSEPVRPLTIAIESGLSFDRFAVGSHSGGVAEIDPQTGSRRLNGALIDLGGFAVRGEASLRGDPGRPVRITLPSRVMLTTPEGDEVELTDLRSDLPANPQLDETGRLRFSFGGQLLVQARSAGDFRGRVRISAEYQ